MKKTMMVLLLSVVSLAMVFAAASNETKSAEPQIKECFVIGDSQTLSKLDPMSNNSTYNRRIYEMTHDTLVNYNLNTATFAPGIAKSWEVSDDALTYTFHLQEGVKFHNGHDCTAEDVVYSFNRMKESSTTANYIASMESIEAIDDNTVVMHLSKNNVEFLVGISNNSMVILDKEALDADPEKGGMIGTGPYIFKEWVPDDYVLLERNDNYWGEKAISKQIKYRMIPESAARSVALQTGEIDLCLELPAIDVPDIKNAKGVDVVELPSTKIVYCCLNVSGYNKDVLDVRVRQALNYATDRNTIRIALTEGYGKDAHGVFVPSMWGYSESVKDYTYDVEKAKALLAEAGYTNGLTISISYPSTTLPGLYEILQAMWAKAGVNLILNTDNKTVASAQTKTGEYDIYASQFLVTSIGEYNEMYLSTSGSNRPLVKDPVLDEMLLDALTITNRDARLAKYAEISQYITDAAYFIPFYVDTLFVGVRDGVEGYQLLGNNRHILTYCYAVE